ncbi:MAG TPA: zf-HC2 domain-containing protein [Candidatus Eremiobacteraeota bacterium]|nr:MAG: hypothetical protein BWY64_00969 [bacterium ADurb.Bin363]HPZ08305.1 zf-HC2 domain-containing protein [Candidatus Eremiobacteraeota bacterium]
MECKKLLEELSNYIDHNIDPDVCDEIEKHIDGCSPCQVFIETLRETVRIFKENCPQKNVPEHVRKKLRERLKEQRTGIEKK